MYRLITIDLIDTYIFADVFDEDKYKQIGSSESIETLINPAVNEFFDRNAWLGKTFTSDKWEKEAEDYGTDVIIMDDKGKTYFRASMLTLGDKVVYALALVKKYHGGKKRKVDNGEEVIHLMDVAYYIYRHVGHAPDLVAAGFCHDLLEDTDCPPEEIKKMCGEEVLRIVQAVTNNPELSAKKDWEQKKSEYIKTVEQGGIGPMMVSLADKIVNLQALKESYELMGPDVWKQFNRGKKEKLWFEESVLAMLKKKTDHELLKTYESLIGEMREMKEG